jgi:23S rRNA pseudouridine2605 synthase
VHARHVSARPLGDGRYEFEVAITEGRKREVRRLCKTLDLRVERLIRVQFGPVQLGDLPVGQSRPLTQKEQQALARFTARE